MFVRCGAQDDALLVWKNMLVAGVQPDKYTFGTMLGVYGS